MSERPPKRVLIIAEGQEEKAYLDKILSFPNINKDVYKFSSIINAKGVHKIFARYQYELQRGFNDIILIFCDVDKEKDHFKELVNNIGNAVFKNVEDATKIIMFVNPVTLQVVLLHFDYIELTHISKKSNASAVEQLTGIKNYDAREEQVETMIKAIHYNDFDEFKGRLNRLSNKISDVPSTNFMEFLARLESDDNSWIDAINSLRK